MYLGNDKRITLPKSGKRESTDPLNALYILSAVFPCSLPPEPSIAKAEISSSTASIKFKPSADSLSECPEYTVMALLNSILLTFASYFPANQGEFSIFDLNPLKNTFFACSALTATLIKSIASFDGFPKYLDGSLRHKSL